MEDQGLNKKAGTELASLEHSEQLRAAYAGLHRHIPLLYAVALANVLGLHVATGGQLTSLSSPAPPLLLLILWRLGHWYRQKGRELPVRQMLQELRKTLIYAIVMAGSFSAWAQYLLTNDPGATQAIVFFGSLAAVGCAYALSSHLSAASMPLALLGFPIAVRLLIAGQSAQLGMGLSLLLVMALTWRLLCIQNRTVMDLVSSRLKLEQENQRAQSAEIESRRLASVDVLTETANRRALLDTLLETQREDCHSVLALIDLDGFKPVNDAFGHHSGDLVLQEVARRLEKRFGAEALVARMGGDEFAIFWRGETPRDLTKFGSEICSLVEKTMLVQQRPMRVYTCCGIVTRDCSGWASADLIRQADLALYAAKARGKGQFCVFSEPLLKLEHRRAAVEGALASGAAEAEVRVVFQPIANLITGQVVGFEALARWTNSELGLVEPSEFIPAAEQMGAIGPLTDRTLELALACAVKWPDEICLSFNVSSIQLCESGSAEDLLSKMRRFSFDPKRFQMEVTETALLANFQLARENISVLRAAGVSIALDDFGAGHASISYLREMCFDVVKLDGTLMDLIAASIESKQLLQGVIDLCRSIGVQCVAEHVETAEQFAILRSLGCDLMQGYFIGYPEDNSRLGKYMLALDHKRVA